MIDAPLRATTALVFVRLHLAATGNADRVPSRTLSERCADWCAVHRLPVPSVRDIARAMRSMGYEHAKSHGQRVWRGVMWREPDPWETLAAPDILRRLTTSAPVMTLAEFCDITGTARSTFYALRARGEAPVVHRLGNRLFIAVSDAVTWCARRGRHTAVLNIVDWTEARHTPVTRITRRSTVSDGAPSHQPATRTLYMDMTWTGAVA